MLNEVIFFKLARIMDIKRQKRGTVPAQTNKS